MFGRKRAKKTALPRQGDGHQPGPPAAGMPPWASGPGGPAGPPRRSKPDYVPKRAGEAANYLEAIAPGRTPDLPPNWPLYPGYEPRFKAEARRAFAELIPETGPAPSLQGELIRAVNKLWFEGMDHGNVNWGPDFEYFIDLLTEHLTEPGVLGEEDLAMARRSLALLRHCGRVAYAAKPDWLRDEDYEAAASRYPGILDEPHSDVIDLGYIYPDVYLHLIDCCVLFGRAHPGPIAHHPPAWLDH